MALHACSNPASITKFMYGKLLHQSEEDWYMIMVTSCLIFEDPRVMIKALLKLHKELGFGHVKKDTAFKVQPRITGKDIMDIFEIPGSSQIGEMLSIQTDLIIAKPNISKYEIIDKLKRITQ